MKKAVNLMLAMLILFGMLAGCTDSSQKTQTLNPADYETDEKMILVADMPPSPFIAEDVQLYKDLGFTHWILTEDHTPMVYDGTLHDSYKEAIEILTEEGFEIWIRNMQNDPEYFQIAETKSGSNYGYQYTLEPRDITDDFGQYPAVTGFYMMDEPFQITKEDIPGTEDNESLHPAFDQLDTLIAWKNTYYPDAFWHINHVGSGSWDHYPQGTTYADFIDAYVENVLKKLEGNGGKSICMDNYPLPDGGKVIKESFLNDVLVLAHATKNYNDSVPEDQQATMGICLQTFRDVSLKLRDITSSSDVTVQMYTGMACGARLFEYFCYRSIDSIGLYGVIDMNGQPRIYDYIKEANERALPFQRIVCAFDWYGTTVNHGSESGMENIFEVVQNMLAEDTGVLTKVESRYDAVVGCFKQGQQDGYMVVNYTAPDLNQTNMVMLTFPGCTAALVYTEEGTEQVDLSDDGSLRVTLDCGQAAFVIPVK